MELYIQFHHNESKNYVEIKEEEILRQKLDNLQEEEVLIVDIEFKDYPTTYPTKQIGDFLIIQRENKND